MIGALFMKVVIVNKKGCIEMLPVLNPISYEKPV
jgi:hypothetical protein